MTRSVLKSMGAVFAGILAIVILSIATDALLEATGILPKRGAPVPDKLLMLATVYRTIYGVVGGYVTARLAPSRPLKHAVILGLIGIVLGTLGAVVMWDKGSHWYPIALIVLAVPQCWAGGLLVQEKS